MRNDLGRLGGGGACPTSVPSGAKASSRRPRRSVGCQRTDFRWVACDGCADAWWCPQCGDCVVHHEEFCEHKAAKDAAAAQRKRVREAAAGSPAAVPAAKRKKRKAFV